MTGKKQEQDFTCKRKKCVYYCARTASCDYSSLMGHSRGCPTGTECTRFSSKRKRKAVHVSVNPDAALEYKKGART